MKALAASTVGDAGLRQFLDQAVLQRAEHAFAAPARLRRIGRDVLDSQMFERPPDLGQPALVDRTVRLRRVEIVAAAVGVEARRQALGGEHLEQGPKRRGGAFLLDQERRIDRAGRVVHGDDQIERRRARKPGRPRAVLVQHHALERLALALAPMRTAPPRPLHQTRGVELRLHPGVAPAEAMLAHQMLVKMLHVPAPVCPLIQLQHPLPLRRRNSLRRRLAEPPVDAAPRARPPRNGPGSAGTAAPTSPATLPPPASTNSPASQRLNTSRNFCILRSCSHVVRFIVPPPRRGRKPDNSCAT